MNVINYRNWPYTMIVVILILAEAYLFYENLLEPWEHFSHLAPAMMLRNADVLASTNLIVLVGWLGAMWFLFFIRVTDDGITYRSRLSLKSHELRWQDILWIRKRTFTYEIGYREGDVSIFRIASGSRAFFDNITNRTQLTPGADTPRPQLTLLDKLFLGYGVLVALEFAAGTYFDYMMRVGRHH